MTDDERERLAEMLEAAQRSAWNAAEVDALANAHTALRLSAKEALREIERNPIGFQAAAQLRADGERIKALEAALEAADKWWQINGPYLRHQLAAQLHADGERLKAQEAGEYDEVGDWRVYVYDRADLRSFGWHGSDRVMAGLHTSATPQGVEFWRGIENGTATREKMRRAKAFVRRVLEAMEEEDD